MAFSVLFVLRYICNRFMTAICAKSIHFYTGELNERRKAVEMIMHKILEDPDSACYSNCSYSQVKEPVASAFSIGSPFAVCRPPINMNDTNTDSESRSSIRNFPDASLSAVTLENESAITHIDPLLCNQSLSMPLSNIKLDPRFPVIPWVDHSLVFKNTDSLVSLTSCGTVSQPLVVQSHLTDRSESIHPELALNQIFCFGRPTICCPGFRPCTYDVQDCTLQPFIEVNDKVSVTPTLASTIHPTLEANTVGDFCGFMSDSQRDDECITALGCHVPYSTYGDNNQPHSRYLSGESVDSAFAESLLSVRLQSSTEDFTNDLFQQQSYNYKNKQTLSQVETVVSPNSVYSISSSPQSCIDSSGHSHHLLINSHEQNCQNSYVLDESNNNFDRLLPNHIQLPELPCLPSEYYGSGVGGVLLVGTIQQLHDTLNFLQWQAKQKVLSNSTSRIMMTSNEIRNICKTSLPPSIFSEQTMTTSLADCNGSAINFPQSTSFSPDVSLKLDTIQPWSIPKHLTPLSLHLPMNQCYVLSYKRKCEQNVRKKVYVTIMPNKVVNLYTFGNYWISTGFNPVLFRASKFNNGHCCLRHYSTPSIQNSANGFAEQATDKSSSYSKYISWTDPDELAHHLSQRIVAITKYFVVIDKPPNLSVWGHSLTSREAISVINPKLVSTSDLGINDCLPQLSNIITSLEKEQHHNFNNDLSNSCTTVEVPKLYIIEALPAAYSGLILLGRNEKYTNAARKFYKSATLGGVLSSHKDEDQTRR
ncbi:Soluble guanylate cyclase 88E isoform 1 [Schistosoma japonicum]|uniref:Soluble guanylate cyclase 88E isoform 1 n=1 Tax=Schistosoma japonicum TaxID=6182 RepID=A0A4Z2CX30_SCHJA|nr:Soluble guanylate cyclase 88E isoform 1 [Schistosoma japonicum]